jgi:hypothetical protein
MNAARPSVDVSDWPRTERAVVDDSSDWDVVGEEIRGRREKHWVRSPDGHIWLRKRHRSGRPFEPAVEVFALELARELAIESAEAMLAAWTARGVSARGICALRFTQERDELIAGDEVLRGADRGYHAKDRQKHTLSRVLAALRDLDATHGTKLPLSFARVLVFDAWIGNTDRHPGNWSVLRPAHGPARLAPMYDPAACLGAELRDDHALLAPHGPDAARLVRYLKKCRSGFGDGTRQIGMTALVEQAEATQVWQDARALLLEQMERALKTIVPRLLGSFDDAWWPHQRRRLAFAILHARYRWLKERP